MKDFLRGIAMLSLARMAFDMLLPEGKLRKLCDMMISLTLMLSMLRAITSFLHGGTT